MRNSKYQFSDGPPTGVERACEIARALFQQARGQHETDQQTVDAIARRAQLSPSVVRRFLQPSRRPKDVPLGVFSRLFGAYRRLLNQQLEGLRLEVARLEALDPDDSAVQDLLHEARALVRKIEAAAGEVPPRSEQL